MDKFEKDMANVSWIQSDSKNMSSRNVNPMANFDTENFESGMWLKPPGLSNTMVTDVDSPLQKVLNFQQSSNSSIWLLDSQVNGPTQPACFEKMFDKGGNQWLYQPFNPFVEDDLIEEEMC